MKFKSDRMSAYDMWVTKNRMIGLAAKKYGEGSPEVDSAIRVAASTLVAINSSPTDPLRADTLGQLLGITGPRPQWLIDLCVEAAAQRLGQPDSPMPDESVPDDGEGAV